MSVASAVIIALASCTAVAPAGDTPGQATAPTTSSPSATASPEMPAEFIEGGTAQENKRYFDSVVLPLTSEGTPGGREVIDTLVGAGFTKEHMQVTQDRTPLGSPVDSLQFSVQLHESCLIGQVDSQGYTSAAMPVLDNGGCLIGITRTIDW